MNSDYQVNNPKKRADAVRKLFTETSQEYAGLFKAKKTGKNFIFRRRLSLATEAALEKSGQMFDCATGSGEITTAIIATGKYDQATLLDLSPNMLDLTSKRIKENSAGKKEVKADLICEDIFSFAKANSHRKHDLIICLGLIAHTGRLPELMLLLRGLLTNDGIILLQTSLLNHPGIRLERFFSEERYFQKHGYRINYFRRQDIEAAVAGAGLKIVATKRYALGFPFGDRLWSWGNYHLERITQRWADKHGSEAVFVLKANNVP